MPSLRPTALALLIVALSLPAAARALGIEKGVKLGANFADFRGEFADLAGTKGKLGFVGGPFLALAFAPDLAVEVEVLYSMKGAAYTSEAVDEAGNPLGEFDTFINVNYLEVPLLLRGSLPPVRHVRPMIYVGPTFGFTLGGSLTSQGPGIGDVELTNLEAVDSGAAFGVGAGFPLSGRRVLADLRYTTGFSGIFEPAVIGPQAESINSVFSLTLGVEF